MTPSRCFHEFPDVLSRDRSPSPSSGVVLAAERPSADQAFKAAATLAQRDYKLVQLYGVSDDGACGCPKGRDCSTPGKHPQGDDWPNRATCDEGEIESWFDGDQPVTSNVGLLLGPESGVIDVECDSEAAAEAFRRWGLDRVDTPAFRSGRGEHRLFAWEPGLPDTAVVKVEGIEVRLGGGGRAAQTVMPPSWHAKGFAREWLDGKSPDDCPLRPLPAAFREAVIKQQQGSSGGGMARAAREATAGGRVFHEGEGRHGYLYGEAVSLALGMPRPPSKQAVARVHEVVLALNARNCRPPYPEDEVRRWTNDAITWACREAKTDEHPWERMGLARSPERSGEFEPGSWQLTIIQGDPVQYVVAGVRSPSLGDVSVSLTVDEFMSAAKTARKILATTTDVDTTNPTPAAWARLWNGHTRTSDDGRRVDVQGLKTKLLEACEHREPVLDDQRHANVAAAILDYLRRFKKDTADDRSTPLPTGQPRWITYKDRRVLAIRWSVVCARAADQAGIKIDDAGRIEMGQRIRQITGEERFEAISHRGKDGSAGYRAVLWDDRHIAALEKLAGVCIGASPE
jgi:hypothetical protein